MVKIEEIPTEELEKDLRESLQDIQACEAGLACGLVESCGTPIQHRLEQNKHFVKVITAELARRLTTACSGFAPAGASESIVASGANH
jgi:hypothetical protein